jgi:hypothetical protein
MAVYFLVYTSLKSEYWLHRQSGHFGHGWAILRVVARKSERVRRLAIFLMYMCVVLSYGRKMVGTSTWGKRPEKVLMVRFLAFNFQGEKERIVAHFTVCSMISSAIASTISLRVVTC